MMQMSNYSYPLPKNEPILQYLKNSPERKQISKTLELFISKKWDVPMIIDNKEVKTDKHAPLIQPHDYKKPIGKYHIGNEATTKLAIKSCLKARETWANTSFETRANIFIKAAELISTKYRATMNAATMLGQSKNIYQAEIDAICEMVDFLRFNVYFLSEIFKQQPISSDGISNKMEYRPLEGFIYAITPFNFTAIAGNLVCAPALCGNVIIWKPSPSQILSASIFMNILIEAGLPEGVINLITGDDVLVTKACITHKQFVGLHFTGSTAVFTHLWKQTADNLMYYKNYPRIVGETGGKGFVIVHETANVKEVVTALIRGAFEFQGQKCSAASRAYIPKSLASQIKTLLIKECKKIKLGHVKDFNNFMNAVINERAYNRILKYIEIAKNNKNAKIIFGGKGSFKKGYFIEPTIIETTNPHFLTLEEEIFGPVLTVYVYDDVEFENTLRLIDETSIYSLTGAIFSQDRNSIDTASKILMNAAGNFYINDKPTGAVVGQQPFGGSRKSGTNDKAGSSLNLQRWLNPKTIKETFNPPTDFSYPYMN